MDPLWLLLIVPGTIALTIAMMCIFTVGKDETGGFKTYKMTKEEQQAFKEARENPGLTIRDPEAIKRVNPFECSGIVFVAPGIEKACLRMNTCALFHGHPTEYMFTHWQEEWVNGCAEYRERNSE